MAIDTKTLTKWWIQYLKNNKIVDLKSDETGKLNYKRPVTNDDLNNFLEVKTEFSPQEISDAMHMVLARNAINKQSPKLDAPKPKGPGTDLSTWMYYGMRPGEHPTKRVNGEPEDQPKRLGGRETNKLKYDPDSISDIDYRDLPPDEPQAPKQLGAPEPRRLAAPEPKPDPEEKRKPRFRLRKVKEDINDDPGAELDEKDIETIFNILTKGQAGKPEGDSEKPARRGKQSADLSGSQARQKAEVPPEEQAAKKEEDMRKMKRLIRDVMTDSQRKSLWRMLNDQETLAESQINNADIKAILKTAADSREQAKGLGKIFKGLRKDKIDVNDLQQAWKDQGFPDDSRDIKALLLSHGFSEQEVKKVYSEVFGSYKKGDDSEEPDVPGQSPTILKIVQYAKKNNLTQELIQFMQKEYGFKESVEQGEKLVIEDIREIFSAIVREERSARAELIKAQDKSQLGRTKK